MSADNQSWDSEALSAEIRPEASDRHWYAVHRRARHEKQVVGIAWTNKGSPRFCRRRV